MTTTKGERAQHKLANTGELRLVTPRTPECMLTHSQLHTQQSSCFGFSAVHYTSAFEVLKRHKALKVTKCVCTRNFSICKFVRVWNADNTCGTTR